MTTANTESQKFFTGLARALPMLIGDYAEAQGWAAGAAMSSLFCLWIDTINDNPENPDYLKKSILLDIDETIRILQSHRKILAETMESGEIPDEYRAHIPDQYIDDIRDGLDEIRGQSPSVKYLQRLLAEFETAREIAEDETPDAARTRLRGRIASPQNSAERRLANYAMLDFIPTPIPNG